MVGEERLALLLILDLGVDLTVAAQADAGLEGVDRVQVLLNGKPAESLNFTRQATPDRFADRTLSGQSADFRRVS